MDGILLFDYDLWSAKIVECAKVLALGYGIGLEGAGELNTDVLRAFREHDFDLVVLGEGFVVGMHEVDFEGVLIWLILILVKVVLSWHLVTLVPVRLPLAEDWEAWFDVEGNMVVGPLGITRANITYIVIIVEA